MARGKIKDEVLMGAKESMITLSDGDKWITDDSEWKAAGISYEEACKGNLPEITIREFIEKMYNDNENGGWKIPEKLTDTNGSKHWSTNFEWTSAVLGDIAVRKSINPWSEVYEMPWGHVYVVFTKEDLYEPGNGFERYDNVEDYMKECTLR